MSAQSVVDLQEEERKVVQPLVYFLRGRMEDRVAVVSQSRRWTSFKERLGCCGTAWGLVRPVISVLQDEDDSDDENGRDSNQTVMELQVGDPGWVTLAAALAAEREFRAVQHQEETGRVSLLRLMEEGDGAEVEGCCVCMVRKKGAAFIPCGHTFCRACAREVCAGRGSCPLCNRMILQILDIF
ncbi:hypothetical protein QQ045_028013 [Rhodiola kirilowii]